MTEHEEIRHAFERLDAEAPPHDLPSSAEAWSRLQFRLAYQARSEKSTADVTTLLAALYVVAFLLWTTWSGLSASLLAVLAPAGALAVFFFRRVSRSLGK